MLKIIALSVLSCATLATVFFVRLKAAEASTPTGETAENASFKPIVEAPLPDGFPTYTPVGEIEVKRYRHESVLQQSENIRRSSRNSPPSRTGSHHNWRHGDLWRLP